MITIHVGDCRDVLETLPTESVHSVITSPPYWGLRSYGVSPGVWGGEPECEHVWGSEITKHQRGKVGENSTLDGGLQGGGEGRIQDVVQGSFCQNCNAWLGCLGLEPTPELYIEHLVGIFRQVRRVLRADSAVWLNLGDSYCSIGHKKSHSGFGTTGLAGGQAQEHHPLRRENDASSIGLKHKDLVGIPWRVAFALQQDGWWLRSCIIWNKPNCMPESVRDRPTTAHEYVFLLSKSARYYYDADAIREPYNAATLGRYHYAFGGDGYNSPSENPALRPDGVIDPNPRGRNRRTVWTIPTRPFSEAHFATFPPDLVEPMIKAGCPESGTVLDPFFGAGTVGLVADRLGRDCIGIELNPEYAEMARQRIQGDAPMLVEVEVVRDTAT